MRVEPFKKLLGLLVAAILLAGSTATAYADTTNQPYLKAFGADVMSGGWYANGGNCNTDPSTGNYQDPDFSNAGLGLPKDDRTGGILTYAKQNSGNSAGGSSSQYAAFALGEIDSAAAPDGFYSDGALAAAYATAYTALNFANTPLPANTWGGKFEGSVRQSDCIPDYYSKKPASATNINNISQALGRGSGDYSASAGPGTTFKLTNGGGTKTIGAGDRITVFVSGDVYIDDNIVYDPSATVASVPKFALVVSGSIYIDPSVTELDGLYVAEPSDTSSAAITSDNGIIWTCHPNSTAKLDYTYPPRCTSPLVVNGALIAKQVNFLRVNGDIGSASTSEDNLSTVSNCMSGSCNISEIINYTPAMIMGGSFFSSSSSSGSTGLPIDSLISLPPVF